MSLVSYADYRTSSHAWLKLLPAHWSQVPLKHFARVVTGATPSSGDPELWDGGITWATPADLSSAEGAVLRATARTISLAGMQSCATELVPVGSVLLSTRAPIGTVALAGISTCVNQGCRGLVPREATGAPFLRYLLTAWARHLTSLGRGSTFLELSTESLGALQLPCPPDDERRAIASFLDRETAKIDALIAEQERLIALLQEKRQAVISHAVTKGLDPSVPMKDSGVEWIEEVPAHWSTRPIRSLARPGNDSFVDGDWIEAPYITDEGVRLIQTGNIGVGGYREQGYRYISDTTFEELRCSEVVPGDILICRLASPVGRACLAPSLDTRMVTSVDVCILRTAPGVNSQYLVHLFSSDQYLGHMEALCRGGTRDRVSRSVLGRVTVPIPPLEEQANIVEHIDRAVDEIASIETATERAMALLRERRAALITAAVTGQIDVRGLVEPAA